jgi:curved DNA-binding protein CbpA
LSDVGDEALNEPETQDDALASVDDGGGALIDEALRGLGDDEDAEVDFEVDDEEDDEGVVEFSFDEDDGDGGSSAAFDLALGNEAAPAAPAEQPEIDLKHDQQMAIDLAFDGIENKTFYEILLLPRTADEKAIKRSYYRLSKEYHPDKFYRKNLGPFKEKLEVIFNEVNEAYRVLSDAEAREDYDVLVFGKEGKDAASPTEATTTVNFVVDAEKLRAAEKSSKGKVSRGTAKKKKKAPPKFMQDFQKQLATRVAKAKRHMKKGREALDANNHQEAASHFQAAMTLDPRNTRAKVLYKKSSAQHRNARADDFYRQAQDALLGEDTKRAAELMQKAVDCKPTRGKYYNEFGKLVTEHTLQQRVGLELLRKAVELESRNIDYTLDLAKAYEGLGMPSNAVRAYERVLHLDSRRSEAAKALKRLK